MSHEYYNIVIGGEGVRRRSNGINAEKITFFSNFVRVSKGLLSTIVGAPGIQPYRNGLLNLTAVNKCNDAFSEGAGGTVAPSALFHG